MSARSDDVEATHRRSPPVWLEWAHRGAGLELLVTPRSDYVGTLSDYR
jgi:hypothetical protein